MTLHKMVDVREDERAIFQFIEEVQNCPDLWGQERMKVPSSSLGGDENGRTSGETGVKRREALGQACRTLQGWDFY